MMHQSELKCFASVAGFAALLILGPTVAAAQSGTLDAFKCYGVNENSAFRTLSVDLVDQFEVRTTKVFRPFSLCNPVRVNGKPIIDPTAHLVCYKIPESFDGTFVAITNRFGEEVLEVGVARQLCLPADKNGEGTPLNLDHFKCYQARTPLGTKSFEPRDVSLADQFKDRREIALRPERLCNPVDKNSEGILHPEEHLVCYDIKDSDSAPLELDVTTVDQFGELNLTVKKALSLCLPSTKRILP